MSYTPSRVPTIQTLDELRGFVEEELKLLAKQLLTNELVRLEVLHVEPVRLRDGMVVYADGSDWNPGSGDGFYGREGGAWVKL